MTKRGGVQTPPNLHDIIKIQPLMLYKCSFNHPIKLGLAGPFKSLSQSPLAWVSTLKLLQCLHHLLTLSIEEGIAPKSWCSLPVACFGLIFSECTSHSTAIAYRICFKNRKFKDETRNYMTYYRFFTSLCISSHPYYPASWVYKSQCPCVCLWVNTCSV